MLGTIAAGWERRDAVLGTGVVGRGRRDAVLGTGVVGREWRDVGIPPYDVRIPSGDASIVSGTIAVGRDAHIPPGDARTSPGDTRTPPIDVRIVSGTGVVGRERRDDGIPPYDVPTPPGDAPIVSGSIPVGRDAHIPPNDARTSPVNARTSPVNARTSPVNARTSPVNARTSPVNARTSPNDAHTPPIIKLTDVGTITDKYIQRIDTVYDNVSVDKYVIMPDHVHLLISIYASGGDGGMRASRPTVHTVVRSLKTMVTKQIGYSIWQDSYYDKVIRDERGYREIWQYIDENPLRLLENEDGNGL